VAESGPHSDSTLNILEEYRNRTFLGVSIALVLLLTPFSINHLVQGRIPLTLITGLTSVLFLVEGWSLFRRGKALIPPFLAFAAIWPTVWMTIVSHGLVGVYWTYPAMLITFFVMPRTQANLFNGVLALGSVYLAWQHLDPFALPRITATLAITITFTNIFLIVAERLQTLLQDMAQKDSLTGTYNRRHLQDRFQDMDEQQARSSMLLFDIDHFKQVNDTLGHLAGDRILRRVADLARDSIRSVDTLFRIGGEEFVVMLPNTELDDALQVAEKLRARVAAEARAGDTSVTISIGVAQTRPDETWDAVYHRCDQALYEAKEAGRNRVRASSA
jgi:diguanylate cyclase (GGDEF)-like protein